MRNTRTIIVALDQEGDAKRLKFLDKKIRQHREARGPVVAALRDILDIAQRAESKLEETI